MNQCAQFLPRLEFLSFCFAQNLHTRSDIWRISCFFHGGRCDRNLLRCQIFCSLLKGSIVAKAQSRCSGAPQKRISRRARKASDVPRFVSINACSSSIITAFAVASTFCPVLLVSIKYRDSGVIIRIWGGFLTICCLSLWGVSPRPNANGYLRL